MKRHNVNLLKSSIFILIFTLFVSTITSSSIVFAQKEDAKREIYENLIENENMKSRILWYDLSANLDNLNSPNKVKNIVEKTANANINTIVLDVKSAAGFVPYKSDYSPHLSESVNPKFSSYPKDFDLIESVTTEAKKHGIAVHININTFSAGSVTDQEGPAIDNPDWQTVVYDVNRVLTINDDVQHPISGFDQSRGTDQVVIYTPENNDVTPTNRWGIEIIVVDETVIEIIDRNETGEDAVVIPEDGYVISANGTARFALLDTLEVGDMIDLTQVKADLKKVSEVNTIAAFMNPIHPEVQQFTWNIIGEIIENYDINGITLDRARYNNNYTDFSDFSREAFETEINKKLENWPEDILTIELVDGEKKEVPGPYYKEWIKWRAGNIENYFENTKDMIHALDDSLLFNTYVGSWYPLYYSEGVNWGSKNFHPEGDEYWWAAEDYNETGYANHLDFLMTGLYYKDVYIEDLDNLPDWYSVEGAANMSMEATNFETFTYGSLYLLDYEGNPGKFKEAIQMADKKTHGTMLFDLVYLEMYDWWNVVEEVFSEPTIAPHTSPEIPALIDLVSEAQGINNDNGYFTEDTFKTLQSTIVNVIESTKSVDDFAQLINTLQTAIDGLEVQEDSPDVQVLVDLIADAKAISNDLGQYTTSSFEALQEAIAYALEQIDLIETEEQLQTEITLLTEAIEGLTEVEKEVEVDITELENLIEKADKELQKKDKYTSESLKSLHEAILDAQNALDGIVSEKDLDQVMTELQTALDNLNPILETEDSEGGKSEEKDQDGAELPKTATPFFNFMLIGIITLSIGVVILFIYSRKKAKSAL